MDIIISIFLKIYFFLDLYQVGTQCTNEKALEFYTLCTSSNIEVGSVSRLTLSRQVARAVKLNGVVLGWANHRANRLVDLAALTFRFCEASAIAQGVGWSALHSFGCTARQARYAESEYKTILINETFLLLNETFLLLIFTQ
mgnify:CR=1 FL=1